MKSSFVKNSRGTFSSSSTNSQRSERWWFATLLVIFSIFLLLNFLTPLMSDDYNYRFNFATWTRIQSLGDIFQSIQKHYFNSNGRLVTHFFAQIMLWLGKPLFNVCNAAMALLLLLGLCRLTIGKEKNVQILLLFTAFLFVFLPRFAQTMLWLTGACNYLWGTTIILWAMVPFRDMVLCGRQPHKNWVGFLYLPFFLIAGAISENFSPAAILFMGLCLAWQLLQKQKVERWMYPAIAMSAIGFIFMLLSPASQRRNARTLSATASFLGKYLEPFSKAMQMFWDYGLILSAIFFVLFSFALSSNASRQICFLSVALFICGFMSNMAMAATGDYPHRAMTGCLLCLFSASVILIPALYKQAALPWLKGAQWLLIFSAMLLLLQSTPLTYDRYREASAREKEVILTRDKGISDVVTYNIQGKTKFDVFFDMIDLTYDTDYFSNFVFARYYNIATVTIDETR